MPTPAEALKIYQQLSPTEKAALDSRRALELETTHRKYALRKEIRTELHRRRMADMSDRDPVELHAQGQELDRRLEDAGFKLDKSERTTWGYPKAKAPVAGAEWPTFDDDGSDLG